MTVPLPPGAAGEGHEEQLYRPHQDVSSVDLDGETVLFLATTGAVQRLPAPAALVWSLLDGTVTIDTLAGEINDVFDEDPALVRSQVRRLVAQLHSVGFLVDSTTHGWPS